ncbi:hypothetical protein [Sphingopyxis terrae]|uniref:Uncharacterized protein n=1 Tax=Sphingopyxis terrae subsp. ummariensis TaxID=429001 RepID=A0A1Y6ER87_9SPHN|nr:hypothetical protein [Sphingopyxis terrae]SMQ65194.1 hypothetical protein SAMN06295984_1202 [Sphingopyxis terrae subsp. ummariensis]
MTDLSPDDWVAVLKHGDSPTLIVEGRDDFVAFRDFEIENVDWGLTITPVSGKSNLISIFERRNEFSHRKVAFLLDKDEWIFTGIPDFCKDDCVLFTDGYSIENDLIRDGRIYSLLKGNEKDEYQAKIASIGQYLSRSIMATISGCADLPLSLHPRQIIDDNNNIQPDLLYHFKDHLPPQDWIDMLASDPEKNFRGKTLISIYTEILSKKDRKSKYSKSNLMEISAARRGANLTKLEKDVLAFFEKHESV